MESISISRDDRGRFSSIRETADPEQVKIIQDFYEDRWNKIEVVRENEWTYSIEEMRPDDPTDVRREWYLAMIHSTWVVGIFLYLS